MTKANFSELDVIADPEGVVAPIAIRERHDRREFSFALMKEFEREGRTERTAWLQKRHIPAARRLLDIVEERIEKEEDLARAAHRAARRERGEVVSVMAGPREDE